ncbi:MAG: porin [Vibrio toranzoniae]|uniref:porin n=1 Tax=Vibrio toranzoniae TaxID=1194427 RepID=UPI001377D205|nr:porin [Vibrio toranzoniae]NAZ45360.1 porin [Vibrio toranzoniae]NAZ52217.1 porin [Vibrio toranzoniae]NAZ71859.1 porin [Vibrio toranzoniae]NAZ94815.1 porin [Vibrio toranzoniae]
MKKAVLASAVVAALVSGSSLAATVYSSDGTELKIGGRAEFRGDFIGSGGAEIDGSMKNKSRVRLNVGGNTEINDSLSGFGFYEAEQGVNSSADNDETDNFKQRYMYAGFEGGFGAVSVGRQDTAAAQISEMSDVTIFSGDQKAFINAGDEQVNNTFVYAYDADALSLKASLIAGEDKDTNGYGVSGIYTLPMGLGFGLGYSGNDNGAGNGSATAVIAGINYKMDALYLGATYTMGDLDDKANTEFSGVEIAAKYKLTSQFELAALYQKQEEDASQNVTEDTADFFELTGTYKFNKSIRTYIAYQLNNLDEVKDATTGLTTQGEDTLRLGVRYDF